MQFNVRHAKANLSKLIDAALAGEEVVIVKRGQPVVKLVAIPQRKFKISILEGQLKGPGPDFLEPIDEVDIARWEGRK
jgi:prevent-host-death family protein